MWCRVETGSDTWPSMMSVAPGPARRVVEADRYVRSGRFTQWEYMALLGGDVHGKTLGVIGLGRIGRAVARRARGFGMRVLYCDAAPATPEAEDSDRLRTPWQAPRPYLLIGLLLGLALLSKLSALALLPLTGLALVLAAYRARDGRILLQGGLLVGGMALLVMWGLSIIV